jgi:imidazolonepropionase-like amidohydrolase
MEDGACGDGLAVLGAVVAPAGVSAQRPADLVLRNGQVWANDGRQSAASAVAIAGRRIVAVGSDRKVRRWVGARTRVVNLRGAFVSPGFRDQHTHLLESAAAGEPADFYRPTFTPFDPQAAEASRTETAREHEDISNRGETVDQCSRSRVTRRLKRSILVMQREAARQGVGTVVEAAFRISAWSTRCVNWTRPAGSRSVT